MKKQLSALLAASMIASNFSPAITIYASELTKETVNIQEETASEEVVVSKATITPFNLKDYSNFNAYNEQFKISSSEIKSISNNGGKYSSSNIEKAIDNNLSTHWETGTQNSASFKNEVVIEFENVESFNRIAYATRQDVSKGKGFPTQFEIYASLTGEDDDFKLMTTGEHATTGNMVEFKFPTITAKKVKFVYVEANQNWASASEFWFYKEDAILDQMNQIFTNDSKNELSHHVNTLEKLDEFEALAMNHPLYDDYKEDFDNARVLLESMEVSYMNAMVSKFVSLTDERLAEYDELYKVPSKKITSITTNGGQYASSDITKAIDNDINTNWHSGKQNTSTHTNEVIMTLDELTTISRIMYTNTRSRGYAQEFEIYVSATTQGETFEKVTDGQMSIDTNNTMEILFNPIAARRIKFVFTKGYEDWAIATEFGIYKQDSLSEIMNRLFIDDSMNEINPEFGTIEALNTLVELAQEHPFGEDYIETLNLAKELIEFGVIQSGTSNVSKFTPYYTEYINQYDEQFRVNISKISNNGGNYSGTKLEYAIDEDITTHWETGTANSGTFKNEVVLTLDKATEIDRLTYKARTINKGFPTKFSIYVSPVASGDNFQKVSEGGYTVTNDMLEIQFDRTKAKRIKFVFEEAYQSMASIGDIRVYKEDVVLNQIKNLFTNGLMDTVSEEYNTIEKLSKLEAEVSAHPLASVYLEDIQQAKDIINNELQTIKTVVAEQQGNRSAHANQNLKFGLGNDYQPTGIVALAGQEIVVYVDAEPGQPLPQLVFSQQEGSFANWARTVNLNVGKNVITVPQVNQKDGWYNHSVTPGGAVYILNPYTEEQQSKAPTIRFAKGVEKFPTMDANTDEQEFLEFLKDYKARVDEDKVTNPDVMDRQMIDVVEIVSDHLVFTGTATGAYEAYINQGFSPMKTVEMYNDHMDVIFDYLKLDGSNLQNDVKYTRENIRLAQPYGYMYAAGSHIGVQGDVMVSMLTSVGGWGVDHEIGHRLDIGVRTIGEVTNNMIPQYSSYYYNKPDKRIPFESHTYKNVISTDNNDYYSGGYFENLAVFWQLEMIYPGYWGKLNRLYRENNVVLDSNNAANDKLNQLAKYSSLALELDLTEHFERHGFFVSDETKELVSQYSKPEKKIWYANYDYIEYEGDGFEANPELKVKVAREGESLKLTFNVNEKSQNDVLGYEIFKNDELIGFTSTNQFVDSSSVIGKSDEYTVVPYDKRLNQGESVTINALTPSLQFQQTEIHIKLRDEFEPMDLVSAFDYDGQDISTKIVVNSQVNINEKGSYPVEYTIEDNGITVTETVTVHVVSDYAYLSDTAWDAVETQWGTPRRNTNLKGRVNGQIVDFEKGFGIHANGKITYDLSKVEYETFEALVGVDMSIVSQTNSSIQFKVIADGEVLKTTNVLKHADNMVLISVPISGVQELIIEVNDSGNGNTSDHAVIVNPKLTTNNAKPAITVTDKVIKVGESIDFMDAVNATDVEDGDLTSNINIVSNTFEEGKVGRFEIIYAVTDSDQNLVEQTAYITVYEDYSVQKSKYGQFENLAQYNEQFKIPVLSISNNGGNYGNSVITRAIDNDLNTHWETRNPNSSTFANEVIFDLGETTEISRMAYAARRDAGGKGFATKFEIYVSTEAEGDDFYLVGQGTYTTKITDIVEFELSQVSARRVKFKFVEANQGWASLSEVSFYKEDVLADKVTHELFTDDTQTDVTETYNTLEKVDALRAEVKDHPAYALFEELLTKAEQIIQAKVPVLTVTDKIYIPLDGEVDLMTEVSAYDQEDGNLTSKVIVEDNGFNSGKTGEYTVTYTVVDSDQNKVSKVRTVIVYSTETYISDLDWTSAVSGWKTVNKDSAVNTTNKIKLKVDEEIKEFDKGIGAATNAEIIYQLNGDYQYFTTYLGTDKNYNHNQTSIIFKIFADGEEVYTSDVIQKDSPAQFIHLDVSGVQELKLVANDAGDSGLGDFASWADTKLYQTNAKPQLTIAKDAAIKVGYKLEDVVGEYDATDAEDGHLTQAVVVTGQENVNFDKPGNYVITYTVTDSDGNKVEKTRTISVVDMEDFDHLTDYNWKSASQSYGSTQKDQSASANTLRLTKEDGSIASYERGIGAHANATIIYDLTDQDYSFFSAYVGVDRAMHGSVGSVQFEVYVDGELSFDSGVMNSRNAQKYVEVSIAGAKELKLVVKDGGNGIGSDHATWGDTKLHFANSEREGIDRSQLDELLTNINALNANLYTEESWNQLMVIVATVNEQLAVGYNQEIINKLTIQLTQALDELIVATNYEGLIELLAQAGSINLEGYTEDSVAALQTVINQATEMIEANSSSQDEVNQMLEQLQAAIDGLEEAVDLTQVIEIEDAALKSAIVRTLNLEATEVTLGDILKLTELNVSSSQISSLKGLEYAQNLETLDITYNQITDLSPLSQLTKLNNVKVEYQIIEGGMLTPQDGVLKFKFNVINRKGEALSPILSIRNNRTVEDTQVETIIDEDGFITIDTTSLESSVYSLYVVFSDDFDDLKLQVLYMFNN